MGRFPPSAPRLLQNRAFLYRAISSGVIGALIGAAISLIVNCTLVEISLNPYFATYFGIVFLVVGGVILWRVQWADHQFEVSRIKKPFLLAFAIMVMLSGALCFVLEKNWFVGLSSVSKIPLYALLGISVCFALTFSIVDLLNYFMGLCQPVHVKPLVESTSQVYLVLTTAVSMGAIFGFIFGLMDIEDQDMLHLRSALLTEQRYCYPIGLLVGGLSGTINEYLRSGPSAQGYDPVQNPFNEDI
eukprot:GILK01002826.1.p1 GENE.GILK01002826.1~~GILK01002826.1.p1  ORF type:complete len:244 (+),score=18.59 GILK01002826.1:61-792(+)